MAEQLDHWPAAPLPRRKRDRRSRFQRGGPFQSEGAIPLAPAERLLALGADRALISRHTGLSPAAVRMTAALNGLEQLNLPGRRCPGCDALLAPRENRCWLCRRPPRETGEERLQRIRALLATGARVPEIASELEVTEATVKRWLRDAEGITPRPVRIEIARHKSTHPQSYSDRLPG